MAQKGRSPWVTVVRDERTQREQALTGLLSQSPKLESPPCPETIDPMAYFDGIRHLALTSGLPIEVTAKMRDEKRAVQSHARRYFASQPELATELGVSTATCQRIEESFVEALTGLAITPRAQAIAEYNALRENVFLRHFPGVKRESPTQIRLSAVRLPITEADIHAAGNEIATIGPCQTPTADFFMLPREQQYELTVAFGREWQDYVRLLQAHEPSLLLSRQNYVHAPLVYRSVADLKQAFVDYPMLAPGAICTAFFRKPKHFQEALAELKIREQYKRALLQSREVPRPAIHTLEPVDATADRPLSVNRQAIQDLLKDSDITPKIAELAPGDILALTPTDTIMNVRQLRVIIDKNLELLGRSMYERLPVHNPRGVVLERWDEDSTNVAEKLRAGFYGRLSNLSIARGHVTDEDLQKFFGENYNSGAFTPETVAQLVFGIDMRSGKGTTRGFLRMMLVARQSIKREDAIYKTLARSVSNTQNITKSLKLEAQAIARVVTAWSASMPISVATPGSGKARR